MNWLAHVLLSPDNIDFRLGNLLADVVRGDERAAMNEVFRRGAECHRAIDAFTDAHPVVKQSRGRIQQRFRRFSGVLVDVFYDHLLSITWLQHSAVALPEFTNRFYLDSKARDLALPLHARELLNTIVRHDLLSSYTSTVGVRRSLERLSVRLAKRWQRDFELGESVMDLEEHKSEFAADFARFFPELKARVAQLEAGTQL